MMDQNWLKYRFVIAIFCFFGLPLPHSCPSLLTLPLTCIGHPWPSGQGHCPCLCQLRGEGAWHPPCTLLAHLSAWVELQLLEKEAHLPNCHKYSSSHSTSSGSCWPYRKQPLKSDSSNSLSDCTFQIGQPYKLCSDAVTRGNGRRLFTPSHVTSSIVNQVFPSRF